MSSFSFYFSTAKLSFIMGKGRKKTKPRRHACFCSRVMENPHQCGTNGLSLWFCCADDVIHAAHVTWFPLVMSLRQRYIESIMTGTQRPVLQGTCLYPAEPVTQCVFLPLVGFWPSHLHGFHYFMGRKTSPENSHMLNNHNYRHSLLAIGKIYIT